MSEATYYPKDATGAERQRRWRQRQKEKLERAADILADTPEKDRVKRLKDKLAKMQEQRDAARAETSRCKEDINWLNGRLGDQLWEINGQRQDITALKAQIEKSKTPLPDIQKGTPEFVRIAILEKTMVRMQGDLDRKKAVLADREARNEEMRDKWMEQNRRIRDLEKENKRLNEQYADT